MRYVNQHTGVPEKRRRRLYQPVVYMQKRVSSVRKTTGAGQFDVFRPFLQSTSLVVALLLVFIILRLIGEARYRTITDQLLGDVQTASVIIDDLHTQQESALSDLTETPGLLTYVQQKDVGKLHAILSAWLADNPVNTSAAIYTAEGSLVYRLDTSPDGGYTPVSESALDLKILQNWEPHVHSDNPTSQRVFIMAEGDFEPESEVFLGANFYGPGQLGLETEPPQAVAVVTTTNHQVFSHISDRLTAGSAFYVSAGAPLFTSAAPRHAVPPIQITDTAWETSTELAAAGVIPVMNLAHHGGRLRGQWYNLVPVEMGTTVIGLLSVIRPDNFPLPLSIINSNTTLFVVLLLALLAHTVSSGILLNRVLKPLLHKLYEENERNAAILGNLSEGVVYRDINGAVILANSSSEAMLNGDFSVIEGWAPEANMARGTAGHYLEINGRSIEISGKLVLSQAGIPMGDTLVLRDVTQKARSERTKESFLDQIGHELRTPLTAIMGYVDLLKNTGNCLPDGQEALFGKITHHTNTLARMIDGMIDITNVRSSGTLILSRRQTDLKPLIEEVLQEWRPSMDDVGIELSFASTQPHVVINADSKRLKRALHALIMNTVMYSPQGGPVKIRLDGRSNGVIMSLSDSGVGISDNDLPNIFNNFFRGEPLDAAGMPVDVRGTGQGLYLAKLIIEAHGGVIDVESSVNQGTTFTIWLPV